MLELVSVSILVFGERKHYVHTCLAHGIHILDVLILWQRPPTQLWATDYANWPALT